MQRLPDRLRERERADWLAEVGVEFRLGAGLIDSWHPVSFQYSFSYDPRIDGANHRSAGIES
jgi:hypothetical protein